MTNLNQNHNIINQYLKGSFNVDNISGSNPEIKSADSIDVKDTFPTDTARKRKSFVRRYYPVVLIVITLAALPFAWSVFASVGNNEDHLYAEFFTPYDNIFIQRGEMNERHSELEKAIKSYDAANYNEARESFLLYMQTEKPSDAVTLYYSISCMESGALNEAIARLESLSAKTESLFCEQAQWFLSLAYLKSKNREKASAMLQSIILNNSYQQEKAVELLERL